MLCCDSFPAAVLIKIKKAGLLFGEAGSLAPALMLVISQPKRGLQELKEGLGYGGSQQC